MANNPRPQWHIDMFGPTPNNIQMPARPQGMSQAEVDSTMLRGRNNAPRGNRSQVNQAEVNASVKYDLYIADPTPAREKAWQQAMKAASGLRSKKFGGISKR